MKLIRIRKLLLISAALALFASCVPNRKITWLQYRNEYKKPGRVIMDTMVRKYQTGMFNYLLQPDDLLDIKISTMTPAAYNPFNDADRSLVPGMIYSQTGTLVQQQGYYVDEAGFLELPIIGSLDIEGMTISQAEDSLAARVRKYLEKPVVRVKLLNFRFSVIGEVNSPATLIAGDNSLTLIQALGLAGGVSEFGDLSRIKLIRRSGGETYVCYVNLLTEKYLSSPFYYVQPNDVIVVSPLRKRSYIKYMGPNLSLLTTSVSLLIGIATLLKIW